MSKQPTQTPGVVGGGILAKIADLLKEQPALLYGIGGSLLLLSFVGIGQSLTSDVRWLLAVSALVLVLLASLAAWLVVDSRSRRVPHTTPSLSPSIKSGGDMTASGDIGAVSVGSGGAPPQGFTPVIEAGGHLRAGGDIGAFHSGEGNDEHAPDSGTAPGGAPGGAPD